MSLTPDQFRRVEALYHELLEHGDVEREQRLAALEPDEPEVAAEVRRLLTEADDPQSDGFSGLARAAEGLQQARSQERETALDPTVAAPRHTGGQHGPPKQIGRYRILGLLGEGGMGQVYEALQEEPVQRHVALKLTHAHVRSGAAIARFRAEQQALAVMNHHNIARVLDADITSDGQPYFVMELVPGDPITRYCDRHGLDLDRRIDLFLDVLSAVQHAHQKGIIHRDLKPSNILVVPPSEDEPSTGSTASSTERSSRRLWPEGRPVVKVIDFGIAKAVGEPLLSEADATVVGDLVGTPEYMSPEQAAVGRIDIDVRSDVYSLGLVLFELLTGGPPLSGRELRAHGFDEMRRLIRESEVPKPSARVRATTSDDRHTATTAASKRGLDPGTLERKLAGDLDWVVLRAVEKERERRYDSAGAFADDLRRHLADEPVAAGPPTVRYRVSKFIKRNRVAVSAAAALLLLLCAGLGGTTYGLLEARRASQEAETARDQAEAQRNAAEATTQFLGGLFRSADPRRRAGRDISVQEVLDEGVENIDRLADQPATQLSLLGLFGDVYRSQGKLEQSEEILQRVITFETDSDTVTPKQLEREKLIARTALAGILRDRSQSQEAEALLREAIERATPLIPRTDDAMGAAANSLGIVLRQLRRPDEAKEFFRRALIAIEHNEQPPGPKAGTIYNNLSIVANQLDEYDESAQLLRRAIELFATELPEGHPAFGTLYQNLSVAQRNIPNLPGALESATRGLENTRKALGPNHPGLATTLLNYGWVLQLLDRLDEAEAALREAAEVQDRAEGNVNNTAEILRHRLATILGERGKIEEALAIFRTAIEESVTEAQRERLLESSGYAHFAHFLRRAGRLEEARLVANQGLEISNEGSGAQGWLHMSLAHIELAAGDRDQAAVHYRRAVEINECTPTESCSLDDSASYETRATYHALRGDIDRALGLLPLYYGQRHRRLQALNAEELAGLERLPQFEAARQAWRDSILAGAPSPDRPTLEL